MNASSSQLNVSLLAEHPPRQMDGPAMDYFLIELVHTLRASSAVATARARQTERAMVEAGLIPPAPLKGDRERKLERDSLNSAAASPRESAGSTLASVLSRSAASKANEGLDEDEEAVRKRLEAIGAHVGSNITERLCRDRQAFTDTLDTVKFICKDIWVACWDKQVDNLRTNHRGVYVLQDNAFRPIARISSWEGRADAMKRAKLYVAMPAGIIKGALARLGMQGIVVPEIANLPQCTFQVKLR